MTRYSSLPLSLRWHTWVITDRKCVPLWMKPAIKTSPIISLIRNGNRARVDKVCDALIKGMMKVIFILIKRRPLSRKNGDANRCFSTSWSVNEKWFKSAYIIPLTSPYISTSPSSPWAAVLVTKPLCVLTKMAHDSNVLLPICGRG